MIEYSASAPLDVTHEELIDRIKKQEDIDKKTAKLFKALLQGCAGDGVIVRRYFDSDSHARGITYRTDHERAVRKVVSEARLGYDKRNLALDLAHFGYKEGLRTDNPEPSTVCEVLSALGMKNGDRAGAVQQPTKMP